MFPRPLWERVRVRGQINSEKTFSKELLCKNSNYTETNNQLDCFGSEEPHNDDTNSVILSESERSHRRGDFTSFTNFAILRCTQKDETKHGIVSESETIQSIVNQNQLQGKIDSFLESSCPPLAGGPKSMISRRGKINCHVEGNGNLTLNNFVEDIPLTCTPKVRFSSLRTASSPAKGEEFLYANWKNSRKIAFTLAEVLITIGIIGVVAAITLPSVLTNIQNKDLQAQFKKSYSEWNQVSMQFMVDHDQSIPDYTSEYGVGALINELPKYVKGFSKFSNWTFEDKDENGSSVTTTPYPIYALKGYRVATMCDISGYYNDISGRYISFDDRPQKGFNGPRLCFDLNGDKKPNKIGLDIFYFQFTTDGHIISEGTEHPNNNYELGSAMSGTVKAEPKYCNGDAFEYAITCAYYAENDISPKGNGTYWKDFIGKKQYNY